MEKILTIIIPSYNMENYLSQCLDSLLVSNLDRVQVLVVNDGSKDRTKEIATSYSSHYPDSIQLIDKPNGNYGSCINRALLEASGKYVKVLDADDSFYKANFNEFVHFLRLIDCDAVISNYDIVNESGTITKEIRFDLPIDRETFIFGNEILQIPQGIFQMHGITYRTENLIKIGYRQTEGISYTDQEWMFLPMLTVHNMAFFNKPIYRYLVGRAGQTVMADPAKHLLPLSNIITKLIEAYTALSAQTLTKVQKAYAENRLIGSVTSIIRSCLLYNNDVRLFECAKTLDKLLCDKRYDLWEKIRKDRIKTYLPIDYISAWRRSKYDPDNFIVKSTRQLLKLYHS